MVRMRDAKGGVKMGIAKPLLFFAIHYQGQRHDLAFVSWFKRSGVDPESTCWRFEVEMAHQSGMSRVRTDVIHIQHIVMAVDIVPSFQSRQSDGSFKYFLWNRFVHVIEHDAWWCLSKRAGKLPS